MEGVKNTKYIKVRNEKNIRNAYFNKSFNYETKKAIEIVNIYKEDMYINMKGDFLNLELNLLSLLEK